MREAFSSAMPEKGVVFQRGDVDIMLLLEGTYPFVSGGVSAWVHQIVCGFPRIRFGAVFIGSKKNDYKGWRYELPENFTYLYVDYLFDEQTMPNISEKKADSELLERVAGLHECFAAASKCPHAMKQASALLDLGLDGGALDHSVFLHSLGAWDYLSQNYRLNCTDPSFVDYFWSVRTIHTPIWKLNQLTTVVAPAKLYHTVSTGYAGFLGALLSHRNNRPLLISEHGIYTKERKIDLYQAQWINDNRNLFQRDQSEVGYFKQMWIRFFESLAKMAYDQAFDIVSLYESNRQRQISEGAAVEKTIAIPNGIDLSRFRSLRDNRPAKVPQVLCLMGRVVPIKDIKTFIRAMRTVVNQLPNAEGWIAGPDDEDPAYAQECRELVGALGLETHVKFLGFQKVEGLMPKIGLNILSSISEGLPLVVLECFAAGVPSITTDVGSCRQLLFGLSDEDKALGKAGEVVRIADPQALAKAALTLLTNEAGWRAASEAGIARVERFYTEKLMFERYQRLYQRGLSWQG
jgi:glycosyltransferase involved in cell wall biosynthesis